MAARETDIIMDFIVNNKDLYETNKEINETVKEARKAGREAKKMSSYYSDGYGEWRMKQKLLTDESRAMQHEMKYGWMANSAAFGKVLNDQVKARYGFYQLAKAGTDYAGTNKQLMNDIYAQGAALKKVKDERIRLNVRMRQSFMEEAGMFANMTTQAQRISDNYSRMMNPLYMVNKGHLALANSLNKVANNGNAANLALRMLGKGADTKQLNDMVMMINQGLMRFNMIALGSVFTTYLFYGALHKLSMENKAYESSFSRMTKALFQAFKPMITVFQQVAISIFDFVTKIANMISKFNQAHPTMAKFLQGMLLLIPALTLLLSPLAIGIGLFGGFQAALAGLWMFIGPVVTGLAAMSATVWVVAAAIMGAAIAIQKLGGVGPTIDFVKQKLSDFYAKADETFHLTDRFKEFKLAMQNAFQGLDQAFNLTGIFAALKSSVMTDLKSIGDSIKQILTGDFSSLSTLFTTMLPSIIGLAIGGLPGLFVSIGARLLPALAQGLQGGSGSIVSVINNLFTTLNTFLTTQLPFFLTLGLQMIQQLVMGIVQALPTLMQGFLNLLQGVLNAITILLPVLLQAGLQIVMAIAQGILQTVPTLIPIFLQFIQQLIAVITTLLPMLINVGMQLVMMLINGIVQMLPQVISLALQLIMVLVNAIVSYLPVVISTGVKIVMMLIQGIVQILPQLIVMGLRIITMLAAAIISHLPQILAAGVKIIMMLIQGILSLLGQLTSAGWTLVTSLAAKLGSIDLMSVGKNIMQGFLNGITSMFGAIKNAVSDIASSVMSVVRKVTNTHSPSREMFALGEYQSEGFALGIQERQKWVDKAAYNLAMAPLQAPEAVSAANTVNTTNNSNSNSLVFAPKITVQGGTGDGQQVASNVRDELEGLFGDMMNSFNMGAV